MKAKLLWSYNDLLKCLESSTSGAQYKIFEMYEEKCCAQRVELNGAVLILGRFSSIGEAINICMWDSENLI